MRIGEKILYFSTLSSTNDMARQLALQGEAEGTVVVADEQTSGRGTKGRSWFSTASLGLYASIILRPKRPELSLLPLAMGLACRQTLNEIYGLNVALKWPNDLIINNKKVGGLLLESSFSGGVPVYAIFGLGLNLNHGPDDFPEELRDKAISLRQAYGHRVDREEILNQLWPNINFWYQVFLDGQDKRIINFFEQHHIFSKGEEIRIDFNGQEIIGLFDGLSPDGALVIVTAEGRKQLTTGEVSLKR